MLNMIVKTLYHGLVGTFTIAICLRMISRGHFLLDAHQSHQGLPKFADKQLVAVTDDVDRQTVFAVPKIKKLHSKLLHGDVHVSGSYANIGTKAVSDCDNTVETVVKRAMANKVYHDRVTLSVRDWQQVQRAHGFIGVTFVMLVVHACHYVGCREVLSHVQPVVVVAEDCI
jgi:hypothetical protein